MIRTGKHFIRMKTFIVSLIALIFLCSSAAFAGMGAPSGVAVPPSSITGAGNSCNMLFDNGSKWVSLTPGGDLVCGGSVGQLTLGGQETIPYSGTALSGSIAGQFRVTDGSSHMVTTTLIKPITFPISGTPTSSMLIPGQLATQTKFNADFASSTGIAAAAASCGTNPAETDTWTAKCTVSSSLTTIGTVALSSSCVATFATTSHLAITCDAGGRIELDAPATVSGANIAIMLVGHN